MSLMEALAYGTRTIIEAFEQGGIEIKTLNACGGLSTKNALLMQIYANVTGKELQVVTTPYASALGLAIFAAAYQSDGGYESVLLAASHMTHRMTFRYQPETDKVSLYNKLYPLYQQLHDSFWKELKVMKQLKDFKLKEGLGVEIK